MKTKIKKLVWSLFQFLYRILMFPANRKSGRKLFDHHELGLLHKALLSGNLFSQGGMIVATFERQFAELYGVPYAVAATSGTAAIHTALGVLELNPGDEVITAPITDLGTIVPILYQNAIPVFADVNDAYVMDPKDIQQKITSRTKAIIVVHLFGNSCDMEAIMKISRLYQIPVIEDCAQAHVTSYKGKFVGTIGDIGCFSFQQAKHMTTGDGGMTITSNRIYYEKMKLFVDKNYARKGWGVRAYYGLALNYRMNALTASVGIAQLDKVCRVVAKRHELGQLMTALLSSCSEISSAPVTLGVEHSYWLYPLTLKTITAESFAKELLKEGLKVSAGYTVKPIYLCAESLMYKKTYGSSQYPFTGRLDKEFEYKEGLCPKAEKALKQLICIPLDESWTKVKVRQTAEKIIKCAEQMREKTIIGKPEKPLETLKIVQNNGKRSKKKRVAVVGCGYIGKWHAAAYAGSSNVQIAAFVDIDETKAIELANTYDAKAYSTHRQLLEKENLDAVSVCTLPSTHKDITIDFLEAGVNVLCEKPLSVSVIGAKEMIRKAKEKNLVLLTAYKFRFFEEVNKAKDIITEGGIGKIINFRLMFAASLDMMGKWFSKKELSGGGVIMDNGSHAFDLVRYVLGDFSLISVESQKHQYLNVEDTARILVKLDSGSSGVIDMSWSAGATARSYFEIYGQNAALHLDFQGLSYKYNTWTKWKRINNHTNEKEAFRRQIDHFMDAVCGKKSFITTAEDGLKTQEIIHSVYEKIEKETEYASIK